MSAYAIGPLRVLGARPVLGQVAAGLAVGALAAMLVWLATGRGVLLGLAALLVVTGSLWLVSTRRTPLALALFMVYIGALDGYLKLATGAGVMTLLRDILLFAIVAGVLIRAQVDGKRLTAPPLTGWVVAFVVVVLVQIPNPGGGTLGHSLAGVRQHLEFVPLFFLTYVFVRTTRALRVFVILLLLIAAANGVANFLQFRLTPQELAGWGPGYAERVLGQGAFVQSGRNFFDSSGNNYTRPFGLGSESGSGGLIGAFALAGVLALASLFTRLRYLLFAVAMAIAAVTAIITSQGRAVLICAFVVVLAYGLLSATSRGRTSSLLGMALAGVVGLFAVQAVFGVIGGSAVRYQGLSGSKIVQTTGEARGKSFRKIPRTLASYPLGAGLATAGPASGVTGGTQLSGSVDAETELSFMTIETGIPGALLIIVFTARLLWIGFSRVRLEPDRETRVLLAAIIAPLAGIFMMYIPSAVTPTTPCGPYLWASAGVIAYWLITRPAERRREDSPATPA